MKPIESVPALKRRARLLARGAGIPLHAALDRIAAEHGYAGWSRLSARLAEAGIARAFHARLAPGDLVLLGGRPGQGKTLMGLRLAAEAVRAGNRSAFFTLEYSRRDMSDRLRAIGMAASDLAGAFTFDTSEAISAGHVAANLRAAPPGTLAVIDYMQILDQDRTKPGLMEQVTALRAFARHAGATIVLISQIDRSYDSSAKPFPDFGDVRLPNPLDLSLFDKACFLNAGKARFHDRSPPG